MSSTIHDIGTFTALSTLVATVYALLTAFKFVKRSVKGQNLPPGPIGLPILGEFPPTVPPLEGASLTRRIRVFPLLDSLP